MKKDLKKVSIVYILRWWTLICVSIIGVLAMICLFLFELSGNKDYLSNVQFKQTLDETVTQVNDCLNSELLKTTKSIANTMNSLSMDSMNTTSLTEMANNYDVSEISIVDKNGIVIASSNEGYPGNDIFQSESGLSDLKPLLDGQNEFIQNNQSISTNSLAHEKYAGVTLKNGGFVEVGYDAKRFLKASSEWISKTTINQTIGKRGYLLVANTDGTVISDNKNDSGKN